MNRSALKIPCAVLVGVAVGWGIRGLPWWSGGAEGTDGRPAVAGAQGGTGGGYGGGPAGSRGEAGAGKSVGKPSRERVEMLAAKFGQKSRLGSETAVMMNMTLEAAALSMEEFRPLLTLLIQDEPPRKAVEILAVRWVMVDPGTAMAFALEHPEIKDDWGLMSSIFQELARTDLPAAKAALAQLDNGQRQEMSRAVVQLLKRRDSRTALAFAREFVDRRAEAEVLLSMAMDDPEGAAAELTPGMEYQELVAESIASSLLKRDRAAFEAWAGRLQDPGQRVTARAQALMVDAAIDPKSAARAAAAWLTAEPEASTRNTFLPGEIVERWFEAKEPPAEVAAWAAGLPEGPFRDQAVSEVGRVWVMNDPAGVSTWVATLPESEGRDNAVRSLAMWIGNKSPADAFEWARTVGKPSIRYEIMKSTLSGWAEKDSAAAQAAVESLPAGDRGYLMEVLQEQEKAKTKERK